MESKQVVYLSIVFSAFFLSMVFPFRALIGAPLSLVVLAYVSPKLSRKATVEMFAVLMLMNFALDLPDWLAWFTVGKSLAESVGLYGFDWYFALQLVVGFSMGRCLIYGTVKKIVRRSKLWVRYPLS